MTQTTQTIRIDDLIQQLCPDGVEYRPMGEVGTIIRGKRFVKSDMVGSGVPCIHYGEIYTKYGVSATSSFSFVSEERAKPLRYAQPKDVIIASAGETIEDIGKAVAWLGTVPVVIHDACYKFSSPLNPKFVSYFLATNGFRQQIRRWISSSKISSISTQNLARALIPVPPLQVQEEIVRILDTFTQLEAELEAELEARKQQYEHYKERLLSSVPGSEWKTLAEVCESVRAGGDVPAKHAKGQARPSTRFPYPIFSNGSGENALYGYADTYAVQDQAVTISARGTIGHHAVREAKFTPIVRLITLIPDPLLISAHYLDYALDATIIGHSGGSIPQLTVPTVKELRVPVPSLVEQHRLVAELAPFDALVNDLSVGLPAEIVARRQQYEYYRDRLLSFEELRA